ncbi:hypothetical protein JG688_00002453 [Phytophthora aleatoria]|uniref:Uncharacterized protein n=1 Tax=Phytophthora aleatoria TaxID=2496075 RepID=A0A8J5JFB0_9STRA|nr:hypothetical protein JG688_00002453 [Phytophthora aleatoria]
MAAGRVKMLFSDAPPDAFEKLLSPKRKLVYGLFAFGPGTVLGLYLYSVKRQMERKNEAMRLEQVESELSVVQERQDKDLALASAIQEMRDRLRRLEAEAITSRENAAKLASAADSKTDQEKMETLVAPAASESKIEAALAVLKAKEKPQEENEASPSWLTSSLDGTQGRRDKRHQEMLEQDVAAYIAKQKVQTK